MEQPESRHREDVNALDPLILGGIIPDVVDDFVPCCEMAVYYGKDQVTNGCELAPFATSSPPNVQIAGNFDDGSLFTLVMTDPDAPSPAEPSLGEYLHWLVTDIPGGTDPSKGKGVLPYERPKPPAGTHSTKCFAQEHGLGLAVAALYFKAQGMEP
ncbi:protein MOTHER of FT and TFL1 homolog 1 isoform X2 [Selaginella moellendorffii]|uniref:protein MOTHER of FT and TFL1 homolog 1 isoform X2 n=1 Tax=Selaginella moellendorffii TaxID=88036 RepID=UPI000D1CFCC3|nr:protein MOTHER of FT and TFL1 homolog 1 isoform X2 [Selaginella moellendorffii]XP_024532193.1 protein MOTHER of FT and TFL1 homolog 1 isoform X2 [Selaginella moellendorffii]|eukprot:XP_024532192.1 protein MOTHER of FT and TFL1 homolog 1 isoform X2 [Selaginella moellendorffii]